MRTVRSVLPMRTAKAGYIGVSLLMSLLGIFLICRPDVSTAAIGSMAGALLVLFGVFKLIGYFSRDLYRLAFQFDLICGVLLLILGAVILTRPQNMLHFLCTVTGIYVIADGLMKLQLSQDARRFGLRSWWAILATALAAVPAGILLLLRPGESVRLLTQCFGAVLLTEALLNLITVLLTVKIIRHQKPDVIEVQYEEGERL